MASSGIVVRAGCAWPPCPLVRWRGRSGRRSWDCSSFRITELSILEQAAFIAELRNAPRLNVAEIAAELSRSKSWVTMRLGLLSEMSEPVRQQLFAGAFPVYCYMYLMRQFMRMNGVKAEQVREFILAVSRQGPLRARD